MNPPAFLCATTLVAGLLAASPAQAATIERVYTNQGGPACQLSVPPLSTMCPTPGNGKWTA